MPCPNEWFLRYSDSPRSHPPPGQSFVEYSHSRLSTFETCARRFKYRYLDKLEVETEGIEAFVGRRVHEILERLYHHVARHKRPPSLAQVLDRFRKDWSLHYHDQIRIVRTERPMQHYYSIGTRCLEGYYRMHYPFDEGETIAIEGPLHGQLDAEGRYKWFGIADRIVRKGRGHYEIHDYKTSGYLPPRRRFETDRQLALYQIGLEQNYPDVEEVELVWHFLSHNKTIRSRRTPEQIDQLKADVISLIDQVEAEEEFPPTPSPLCGWCDYNQICDAATGRRLDKAAGIDTSPPAGPQLRPEGMQLSLLDL